MQIHVKDVPIKIKSSFRKKIKLQKNFQKADTCVCTHVYIV